MKFGENLIAGEFDESTIAVGLALVSALGLDKFMEEQILNKYGTNAPDPLVAGWSVIFASFVFGIGQVPVNGWRGFLTNSTAVLPYALGLYASSRYILKDSSEMTDREMRDKAMGAVLLATALGGLGNTQIRRILQQN